MNEFRKAYQKTAGLRLFVIAGILISAAGINAEPYLAMRTGFKCSQCHVNRIGGGQRTEYGQVYSQYKLLLTQTEDLMQAGQSSFNPKLNDMVTIGANFRVEEVAAQKYTYTDGAGKHAISPSNQNQITEANFYMNVELIRNRLNLYMDNALAGKNVGAREMFGMVRNLPFNSYVKVGKTLLPYGIRLMDDDAFIRTMTGYTYNTTAIATEVGLEPGPFSLAANVTSNQFSGVGSVVFRHFRVGGSYGGSWKNGNTPVNTVHYTYGPFGGFNFGRFTALGEMDFIKGANPGTRFVPQIADFLELDFLPIQGCNLKTTYEYYDRNTRVANSRDGQDRWTFGIEPFFVRFLQLGLYYRINNMVPQETAASSSPDKTNQDQIIGRVHVFF